MSVIAADNEVMTRYQNRGRAMALLLRRLRSERSNEQKAEDKKLAASNEFLQDWTADASEESTKKLLEDLQAQQEEDAAELTKAADEVASKGGDEAAVALLKKAEEEHGKLSDEELTAAMQKLDEEIAALNDKLKLYAVDSQRRFMTKQLEERLNIKTSMDRAILERVVGPDKIVGPEKVASKTKINKTR